MKGDSVTQCGDFFTLGEQGNRILCVDGYATHDNKKCLPDRWSSDSAADSAPVFRFGIPVSKLAGGLVVNHLIEVGKRDHQQRPRERGRRRFQSDAAPGLLVCS